MDDGFAAICVRSGLASVELCERAPLPPVSGDTSLKNLLTHLHFAPEAAETLALQDRIAGIETMLLAHWRGFREYRRLTPFCLAVEWHYENIFELTLSVEQIRLLARLGAPVGIDVFWKDDGEYVERIDHRLPFNFGECTVRAGGVVVKEGLDGAAELGRYVQLGVRRAAGCDVIEFDVRGGCGRPVALFSANALRAAAANGSKLTVRVAPREPSRSPSLM